MEDSKLDEIIDIWEYTLSRDKVVGDEMHEAVIETIRLLKLLKDKNNSHIWHLCFKLSMPNVGSWNGQWAGRDNIYAKGSKFQR